MGAVAFGSLWGVGYEHGPTALWGMSDCPKPCNARQPQSEFTSVPKAERAQRSFSSDPIAQSEATSRLHRCGLTPTT